MAVTAQERSQIIAQLETIWRNPLEAPERRRKAKTAWKNLTDTTRRSYGDPANFVSVPKSKGADTRRQGR